MRLIYVGRGKYAKVNNSDYLLLDKYKWHLIGKGYAARQRRGPHKTRGPQILMHNQILGCKNVDHKNTDRLDNRRLNLRRASSSQNKWNRGKNKNNTSGYKGVSWNKKDKKWTACIGVHRERIGLGYFSTPEAAALAYNKAARKLHGKFCVLNVVGAVQ